MSEMSEAAREARRAYDRAYYRRNPEKQREKMRRYWERKSAQNSEQRHQDKQINERSDDKETVITHLMIIKTWASFARERDLQFFTEKHLEDMAQWADEAIALLKEQDEREKRICKKICDFIRGSCSTDTYADKEFVCHEIQKCFMKGR